MVVWSCQESYSTGLCDLGEVLTALSFAFRVSLEDWISSLLFEERSSESSCARQRESAVIRVNLIQVCRDDMGSPWSGLADQCFLEHLYNAGFYLFTLIQDVNWSIFVAPTKITKDNQQPTLQLCFGVYEVTVVSASRGSQTFMWHDKLKEKAKTGSWNVICALSVKTTTVIHQKCWSNRRKDRMLSPFCASLKTTGLASLTFIFLEKTSTTEQS